MILESKKAKENLGVFYSTKLFFQEVIPLKKCTKRGCNPSTQKVYKRTIQTNYTAQIKNQELVLEWRIKYWYHRFDYKVERAYPQQSKCEIWPLLSIHAVRSLMDLHASTSWMIQNIPQMDGRQYLHKIIDPTTIFRKRIHFSPGKKKWMQIQPTHTHPRAAAQ